MGFGESSVNRECLRSVYVYYTWTAWFRLGQPRNDQEAEGGFNSQLVCVRYRQIWVWGGWRQGESEREVMRLVFGIARLEVSSASSLLSHQTLWFSFTAF